MVHHFFHSFFELGHTGKQHGVLTHIKKLILGDGAFPLHGLGEEFEHGLLFVVETLPNEPNRFD